jgi:predicted membrane-bound spermidine synthase
MIALLLFFGTGAMVLLYEVVWARYLTLLLGQSAPAQTLALGVFLAGLAIGHRVFGSRSMRTTRPLAYYGRLELLLAVYAIGFDHVFRAVDTTFTRAAAGMVLSPWLPALKIAAGGVLLIIPTMLMGGALPMLATWIQQHYPDASRRAARAYSVGAFGGVAGLVVAGGAVMGRVSLMHALWVGAALNGLVGLLAIAVSRFSRAAAIPAAGAPTGGADTSVDREGSGGVVTAACYMVALAGAALLALEVLTSRAMGMLAGASQPSLWLVSAVFFFGIGLGATVVASPGWRWLRWGPATVSLVLVAAMWVGGLALAIEQWVQVFWHLSAGLVRSTTGYWLHLAVEAGLVFLLLGVPAALVGAILPLSLRLLGGTDNELGNRVGRLMAWSIAGGLAGVWITGHWLMPLLNLRGAYLAVAVVLCLAGSVLALSGGRSLSVVSGLVLMGALVWGAVSTGASWQVVLTGGVYRFRETKVDARVLESRRQATRLSFYQDAPDSTVSVEAGPAEPPFGTNLVLRLNGEPEASSTLGFSRHVLTGHLPMLSRPRSTNIFILGWGGGGVAGAVLQHPVNRVVVAERSPSVLLAARQFNAINLGAIADPRLTVVPEDGRMVLRLSPDTFDIIISEPPSPWVAGADGLFSQEFYRICAGRLRPDGLMAQWLPAGEMSDEHVLVVLRTFGSVFPSLEIWDMSWRDVLLLGSQVPWPTGTNQFRAGFERESVRRHLALAGLRSPASVWARQLASQRTAWAIAGEGSLLTDARPRLASEAPLAFFVGASSRCMLAFDERWSVSWLAPDEKRHQLGTLPAPLVRSVFDPFPSYLGVLSEHLLGSSADSSAGCGRAACAFHPTAGSAASLPEQGAVGAGDSSSPTGPWRRRLAVSEGDEWARAAAEVLTWLRQGAKGAPEDLEAVELTESAARAAFLHGEVALAADLVRSGLSRAPENPRLDYLRRIAEREAPFRTSSKP